MLRTVKLERFRGFTSLSLSVAPATVIVGRNSSGKSTVLHAIRLAFPHPRTGARTVIECPPPPQLRV